MNFSVHETQSLKTYSTLLTGVDPLEWIAQQTKLCEKFYLKLRDDSYEWAGVENLFENTKFGFEEAYALATEEGFKDSQIFMAHSFDLDPSKTRFILPRIEILKKNDLTTLRVNFWKNEVDVEKKLSQAQESIQALTPKSEGLQSFMAVKQAKKSLRKDSPTQDQWVPYFDRAQNFLENHSKVVLARLTEATFETPINPFSLLESLKQDSYRCYLWLPNGEQIVSVSPERLFKIEGNKLSTEAVAGTKPRDADPRELLDSKKERAEHQFVVDEILRQIEPYTDQVEIKTTPQVASFKKVIHLKTPIKAKLKNGFSVFKLIQALHPTPAVGGLPKTEALDWLKLNEPFKREYYAAPIGVIGFEFAEFFVNIRSVQILGQSLKLYSGVGIVKDSRAESEWSELDLKASQFWDALS